MLHPRHSRRLGDEAWPKHGGYADEDTGLEGGDLETQSLYDSLLRAVAASPPTVHP